jgi:hypothetical protein
MKTKNLKWAILVSMVALFLCACWIAATPTLTPTLRYDGLYQSVQQDSNKYLRFYEDGTVLSVGSTGNPEEVAAWLNKACQNCSVGQYVIRDSVLEFTTTSNEGTVDYTGTVNGEELTLDIYSHINGFEDTYVYHFVENPGMQP